MPPQPPSSSTQTLLLQIINIQSLIKHFATSLTTNPPSEAHSSDPQNQPPTSQNPLTILRDASLLLKAQTTKLSLLILNEPFTASAVSKVLIQCEGECLPGFVGAVEGIDERDCGRLMMRECRRRVFAVLSAFGDVLEDVKRKAEGDVGSLTDKDKDDVLARTGLVWGACDELVALQETGIVGFLVKKVEGYRGMLVDAIEELKEWGEDAEDLDEGFVGSDDDEGHDGDSLEGMFNAANRLPAHRKDLRDLLSEALRRLKLVNMLFQALLKRRIKTFSHQPTTTTEDTVFRRSDMRKLDRILELLKTIPEDVDDLASAFYELDAGGANVILEKVCEDAKTAAEMVSKPWDLVAADDEYTIWVEKWKVAMEKKRNQETGDENG